MSKKETIRDIAISIGERVADEQQNSYRNKAVARCLVTATSTIGINFINEPCFLTNQQNITGHFQSDWTGTGRTYVSGQQITSNIGRSIYKNTKLGEILTKFYQGTHEYIQIDYIKRKNVVSVTVENKATYNSLGGGARDVEIRISGDDRIYRYANLYDLLKEAQKDQEELTRRQEELRKLQEEKKRQQEEAKIAEEAERKRIEEEIREKEEAERKIQEEAERIKHQLEENTNKVKTLQSFLRRGVTLRSQHLLDEYQETAKRSHLFDGCAVIIDGGPGTGKTTTTIQRLKFLLSKQALEEYENPLTKQQIDYLTDPQEWNQRWLFFSPTDLLLQYLRDNMREEELIANDRNTRTIDRFRKIKMRDYGLFDPSKDGPFKDLKTPEREEKLIKNPRKAISDFEQFCISFIRNAMEKRVSLPTESYSWHLLAVRIKATYQNMKVKDLEGLMRLLNALRDRERAGVKEVDAELKNVLDKETAKVKIAITYDNESVEKLTELFERWRREQIEIYDEDENDVTTEEVEAENEELVAFSRQEFEGKLATTIRSFLRKFGLWNIDSKTKFSKRDNEFMELIDKFLTDDIDIERIGELAWFTKNFASMCRGLESGLILQIPKMYKAYRKQLLASSSNDYNIQLLEAIVKKDNNKHLHPEEQSLLIGFMNNMFFSIFKKSKVRFDDLKNKYVVAYRESVRPVIGIDEATDYSLLDYYFMISFRHYEFSAITLCGDIMQGLNDNGIRQWEDLRKSVLPNLEIVDLNISYRQLPTLLDVSREMYKDDQGSYPTYKSNIERSDDEPQPLLLVSDDEEEKAMWIAKRIVEIFETYGTLPSVAIFVGDDVDITQFIERIEDLDILNGIEVVDCSGGRVLDSKEVVRVFRLSEVKGMEFEAVFFYDIDVAIKSHSSKIMRRYLYVGVSRATSHLAATMTKVKGNENIMKYFDRDTDGWL